jgi:hypothetical protein
MNLKVLRKNVVILSAGVFGELVRWGGLAKDLLFYALAVMVKSKG